MSDYDRQRARELKDFRRVLRHYRARDHLGRYPGQKV
jgi:hypothetical protein